MKTLSSPRTTAAANPVTRPAYLVDIAFSSVSRYSSAGTVSYGGNSYAGGTALRVVGLEVEALRIRGSIHIGNVDDVIGALVLAQGVSDKAINVYEFDAAATASGDITLVAAAVGASAVINEREVVITLRHPAEQLVAPRAVVNAANGFNWLMPAGAVVRIAGTDYRLERR